MYLTHEKSLDHAMARKFSLIEDSVPHAELSWRSQCESTPLSPLGFSGLTHIVFRALHHVTGNGFQSMGFMVWLGLFQWGPSQGLL